MKNIITIIIGFGIALCIVLGMDREMARQDYLKVVNHESDMRVVDNCIFKINCDHYNNLLKGK